MATTHAGHDATDLENALLDLVRDGPSALRPKRIEVARFVDGLGEEAWQLTLILPRPKGETWDRQAVFETRMRVTGLFDQLVVGTARELPGRTLAVVTTDEAQEIDVAEEGVPEEGEEPEAGSGNSE